MTRLLHVTTTDISLELLLGPQLRAFRHAGDLYTTAWTAECFDRWLIWRQAEDRLMGRVPGVPHH